MTSSSGSDSLIHSRARYGVHKGCEHYVSIVKDRGTRTATVIRDKVDQNLTNDLTALRDMRIYEVENHRHYDIEEAYGIFHNIPNKEYLVIFK